MSRRAGQGSQPAPERDSIDAFIDSARRAWPDLDWEIEAAAERIIRVGRYLEQSARHAAATVEDVDPGTRECLVLVSLRGGGPPYQLTPSALRRRMLISSGAMTNVLSRLETAGMLVRLPDPRDGRGIMVELTPRGQRAADEIMRARSGREASILNALSRQELTDVNNLLKKVIQDIETPRQSKSKTSQTKLPSSTPRR
jgi:DNA-binding MarR family transcriptional regulator